MALILNIDTATSLATICLSSNGNCVSFSEHNQQKEHASFVHKAILNILHAAGLSLDQLDAIAVTSGPGSYTGLRVGMATAKGFCYALSKPLILINTLRVMAAAALEKLTTTEPGTLLCPMIDARRMEVFTALYNRRLETVLPPQALLLDETSFNRYTSQFPVIFFGNGSLKAEHLLEGKNAVFASVEHDSKNLGILAEQAFQAGKFADITYAGPEYLKEFHAGKKAS